MRPRKLGITATAARQQYGDPSKAGNGDWKARVAVMAELADRLVRRDGSNCWYCGIETTPNDRTVEHLLAVSRCGSDDLANLCVACASCNVAVAALDIVSKVRYRDQFLERQYAVAMQQEIDRRVADVDERWQRNQTVAKQQFPHPNDLIALERSRIKAEREARNLQYTERRNRDETRRFVTAAKVMLPKDQYMAIWQLAAPALDGQR